MAWIYKLGSKYLWLLYLLSLLFWTDLTLIGSQTNNLKKETIKDQYEVVSLKHILHV